MHMHCEIQYKILKQREWDNNTLLIGGGGETLWGVCMYSKLYNTTMQSIQRKVPSWINHWKQKYAVYFLGVKLLQSHTNPSFHLASFRKLKIWNKSRKKVHMKEDSMQYFSHKKQASNQYSEINKETVLQKQG